MRKRKEGFQAGVAELRRQQMANQMVWAFCLVSQVFFNPVAYPMEQVWIPNVFNARGEIVKGISSEAEKERTYITSSWICDHLPDELKKRTGLPRPGKVLRMRPLALPR